MNISFSEIAEDSRSRTKTKRILASSISKPEFHRSLATRNPHSILHHIKLYRFLGEDRAAEIGVLCFLEQGIWEFYIKKNGKPNFSLLKDRQMDLGLIASNGCPLGLGVAFNSEKGCSGMPKELHRFLQYQSPNQDLANSKSFTLCQQQKEELKFDDGLLDCNDLAVKSSRMPALINVQDIHPQSLLLGFGIAEQCTRQEKILELLASGSIEVEDGLVDLSKLYDLLGPQQLIADPAQQSLTSCSKWCFCDAESEQSLIYPASKLYINEPILNLVGYRSSCRENSFHPTSDDMAYIAPAISDQYFSKNPATFSKRTMLVPYFERRRRGRSNTDSSKLAPEKVASLKSHVKVKSKSSQKRKIKERDISSNSYLHACESLLSVIVDRKRNGKNVITSLKKSGPQLNDLLSRFSASIAGTGVAVVLSVICRIICNGFPFSASKLLSTGLGFGLIWIASAVNKLRNTVISISKSSGKAGCQEEQMMDNLDRNLKEFYSITAAVMAIAVLRLA